MGAHYNIEPGHRIPDVGCSKSYMLYEFTQVVPDVEVVGVSISEYVAANGKDQVMPVVQVGNDATLL